MMFLTCYAAVILSARAFSPKTACRRRESARVVRRSDASEEPEVDPVIMRVSFRDWTEASLVRSLVGAFPFDTLRNLQSAEETDGGNVWRLLFTRDSGELDGGLKLGVVFENDGRGPFLDISRLSDGRAKDDLPPVIREKQVGKKIVAALERDDSFLSSRIRAFGSGSF